MPFDIKVDYMVLTPCILAYPTLMTPRAYTNPKTKQTGKPQFNANFLFTLDPQHIEIPKLVASMRSAAQQKWGAIDNAPTPRGMARIIYPALTGSDYEAEGLKESPPKTKREAFRPYWIVKSSSDFAPALAAVIDGVSTDAPHDGPGRLEFDKYFYGGALVQVIFRFVPMLAFGDTVPMVKAYLQSVRAVGGGEPVKAFASSTGAPSATKAFGGSVPTHTGHVSSVNPLG